MKSEIRVFGVENSPYSIKVRSYLRYKGIPHEWVVRSAAVMPEFQKYAKLPLVPLVVMPDEQAFQDSTPILERFEAAHPEPSIHPDEPVARFVSALLEEFGDEWGNKWMFHYRWARPADQQACSKRLVAEMMPLADAEQQAQMAAGLIERMTGRVWFVGSNETTAPQIEASFREAADLLEAHLAARPFLFGRRPAFGDFGLWGQLYNARLDPTPASILAEQAPSVVAWTDRMLEPKVEGDFEPWSALAPTLAPLLSREVGRLFLPWSDANARAIEAGDDEFSVDLDGETWTQKPQKYHARSLAALRKRYAEVGGNAELDALLADTGCLEFLRT